MIKNLIITVFILIPFPGFSQYGREGNIHIEGVSVKTDAFLLFNGLIGEPDNYSIAGEIYFNYEYSMHIELASENESERNLNRFQKRFTGQFRWYFSQDDCSCSAFFGGVYFGVVNINQAAEPQYTNKNAVDFNRTSYEGGVCFGYQTVLAEHFIIDPAAQIGLELYHTIQYVEPVNTNADIQNKGLLLRIQLGIGYRF